MNMQQSDMGEFLRKLEKDIASTELEIESAGAMQRIGEILETYEGPDRVVTSEELAEIIRSRPEENKYMTRIVGLNKILDGFREQQLVVIAAPTKHGKTTFAVELTKDLQEHHPCWFPFEESAEEIITKFIERGHRPPHFVTPVSLRNRTLAWIEERIVESIVKYDTKIVFIDHLHFIVPFTNDRTDQEIGKVMRELKRIAKQLKVVVFLIAHLKKTKVDIQPDMEDLRDSSFVGQEADTVIMLWRETKKKAGEIVITNNVNVSVQANRRTGRTGNVKLVYTDGGMVETDWSRSAYDYEEHERDF